MGACVDDHPVMQIQFFIRGPFDPIESLSVTFRDSRFEPLESVVMGGSFAQYELWNLVASIASDFMAVFGSQGRLDLDP